MPVSYDYPRVGLPRFLDDAARDFPDTAAMEFAGARFTYSELLDDVDRLAHALHDLGLGRGERVGVVLPNCPQHVTVLFAAWRVGAVVAEHDPLTGVDDLAEQLADAECEMVLLLQDRASDVSALRQRVPAVRRWILTGLTESLPWRRRAVAAIRATRRWRPAVPLPSDVVRLRDLLRRQPLVTEQADLDPERDLAVLVRPTAGGPAIMLTHANLVTNAFQLRLWIPDVQSGQESILAALPFWRADGLTACVTLGVLIGATLALVPSFDRRTAVRTITRARPTVFPGVPSMFTALVAADGGEDLSSLRVCLSHGALLAQHVVDGFEERTGARLRHCYGRPEASLMLLANPVYGRTRPGTVGLPLPDTVVVLLDPEDRGRPLTVGGSGELAVAGPQVMAGYWGQPEATAAVLHDGWLLTGDRARMDADGYVALVEGGTDP